MSTITENSLKEVKNFIDRVMIQNEDFNQQLNHLTIENAVIKESINGLNKLFDNLNKQLENWKPTTVKTNGLFDLL